MAGEYIAQKRVGYSRLTFWLLWSGGILASVTLLLSISHLMAGEIAYQYRMLAVLTVMLSIPVYSLFQVYRKKQGVLEGLLHLLLGSVLVSIILVFILMLTNAEDLYAKKLTLEWMLTSCFIQAAIYMPFLFLVNYHDRKLCISCKALIIGDGALGRMLGNMLIDRHENLVAGFVSLSGSEAGEDLEIPILGTLDQLHELIEKYDIRRVYIALPSSEVSRVERISTSLLDICVDVIWLPHFANPTRQGQVKKGLNSLSTICLNISPLTAQVLAEMANPRRRIHDSETLQQASISGSFRAQSWGVGALKAR